MWNWSISHEWNGSRTVFYPPESRTGSRTASHPNRRTDCEGEGKDEQIELTARVPHLAGGAAAGISLGGGGGELLESRAVVGIACRAARR